MSFLNHGYIRIKELKYYNMTSWEKIKSDPVLKGKYNEYMRSYLKNKYDNNPEYKEKMQEKARQRKAMLRELNNNNS